MYIIVKSLHSSHRLEYKRKISYKISIQQVIKKIFQNEYCVVPRVIKKNAKIIKITVLEIITQHYSALGEVNRDECLINYIIHNLFGL